MDRGRGSGEAGESHHHAAVARLRRVRSVAVVFGGRGPRSLRVVMHPGLNEGRGIAAAVERTPSVHEEEGKLLHRRGPPRMNLAGRRACRLRRRSQIPFPLSTHQRGIATTRDTPNDGQPHSGPVNAPKGGKDQAAGSVGDTMQGAGKNRHWRDREWRRSNTSMCSAPATRT